MKEFSVLIFFTGVLHFEFCTALGCVVGLMEITVKLMNNDLTKLPVIYLYYFYSVKTILTQKLQVKLTNNYKINGK